MIDPVELSMRALQTAGLVAVHTTGPVKAMLYCLDDSSLSFTLPFNPPSLQLVRNSAMGAGAGRVYPGHTPNGVGNNDTLSFETLLDASELSPKLNALASMSPYTTNAAGTTSSVLEDMEALYKLTVPGLPADEDDEVNGRAPVVVFLWEKFRFTGIVQDITFDVKLFDALGAPRRATVRFTMTGRAFFTASDAADVIEGEESMEAFSPGFFGPELAYAKETAKRAIALRLLLRLV